MLMQKKLYTKVSCLFTCLLLMATTQAFSQTDYQTIIKRVDSLQRITITVANLNTSVATHLGTIQPNGSWTDMDYADDYQNQLFKPVEHVEIRVMNFALAYTSPTSTYYQNNNLYDTILKSLRFWYVANPDAYDWYYDEVRCPTALGRIMCIMRSGLNQVPTSLEDSLINNRMRGRGNPPAHGLNSNQQNVAFHYVLSNTLQQQPTQLTTSVSQVFAPILFVTPYAIGEGGGYDGGYQIDGSYLVHGPQMQTTSYGSPAIGYMYGVIFANTAFAMPVAKRNFLSDYTKNHYLKAARGRYFDWQIGGRDAAVGTIGGPVLSAIQNAKIVDPANNASWDAAIARITQAQPPGYNVSPEHIHYWLGDYDVHNRPGYSFNIKTVSTRTARTEKGNGTNLLGRYLPDGGTAIMRKGDEYLQIGSIWEWDKIPGITSCDYSYDRQTSGDWGYNIGSTSFVGGASDSLYGVTAYDLNFDNVQAKKSWFQFDNEIVCLGAGIKSTNTEPVVSTMNQSWLRGAVTVSDNGTVSTLGTNSFTKPATPQWVLHDTVGYFFPQGGDLTVSNKLQTGNTKRVDDLNGNLNTTSGFVYKLFLNHGSKPANGKYAYIVAPGIGTTAAMQTYQSGIASNIRIVTNSDTAQAVRHLGLDMLQVVFYKAGSVTDGDVTVAVSKPCIVQLKNVNTASVTMHIADPTNTSGSITVALKAPSLTGTKQLTVAMPENEYRGSTKKVMIDNSITTTNLWRSSNAGVTVDLGSSANWQNYNGSTWVNATTVASGNLVATDTIIIMPNDTWVNNIAATSIPTGAVLIDSSALFGTFSTTNKFTNNGKIIFAGSSLQTIPGQSAIGLPGNGGGTSWGDLIIDNTAGVTSTQNGNFFHVNNIELKSGTFTAGSSGGLSFYLDGEIIPGAGRITSAATGTNFGAFMAGNTTQTIPANSFVSNTVATLQVGFLGKSINSVGPLTISAKLQMQKGTTLTNTGAITINNYTIDSLTVGTVPVTATGTATLSGAVVITKFSGYPFAGQKITVLTAGSISGAFTSAATLPSGYTGTVANVGNTVVLTIATSPNVTYRSRVAGGSDLVTLGSWETFNGTTWVTASSPTVAPNVAPANSTIIVRPGHVWLSAGSAAAETIPAGVTLVDSSAAAHTFTTKLTNNGMVIFCASSAQTVPGQGSLGLNYSGYGTNTNGGSWGNIIVNNPSGVTSTQATFNSVHVKNILLQSGTFYVGGSAGAQVFVDSTITVGTGNLTTNPSGGTNSGLLMYGGTGRQTIPTGTALSNTLARLTVNNTQGATSNGPLTITGFVNLPVAGATLICNNNLNTTGLTVASLDAALTPVTVAGVATISGNVSIPAFTTPAYNGQQIILLEAGSISGVFNTTPSVLPSGYTGTISNVGKNVILTITSSTYGNYRSKGNVDLGSAANWEIYNGTAWANATAKPSNNALYGTTIGIRPGHTWSNNIEATNIPYGVTLADSSSSFGTFSTATTGKLSNGGTIVFCGRTPVTYTDAAQNIPAGATSLSATTISGGAGSWGNVKINNTAGVSTSPTSGGNFIHVGDIELQAGTFKVTAPSGQSVGFNIDGNVIAGSGNLTTETSGATNFGITLYRPAGDIVQTIPAGSFLGNAAARFTVNNPAGVVLQQPLATGILTLTNGKLTIGDNNLSAGSIAGAPGANNYVVTNGTGGLKMSVGSSNGNRLYPIGYSTSSYTPLVLANAGTTDSFTVKVKGSLGSLVVSEPDKVVPVLWDVAEDVAGGSSATISLQWNATDAAAATAFTPSTGTHVIGHYTGGIWESDAATVSGTGPYMAVGTKAYTSFSPFAVGMDGAFDVTLLPLGLISFSGEDKDGANSLQWVTEEGQNFSHFEIEHSVNGAVFNKIGKVYPGSKLANSYSYTDKNTMEQPNYYRLGMVGKNGKFNYSRTVRIASRANVLVQIFPNPASSQCTINARKKLHSVILYDVAGKQMKHITNINSSNCILWLGNLPEGAYLVEITGEGFKETRKLVKR